MDHLLGFGFDKAFCRDDRDAHSYPIPLRGVPQRSDVTAIDFIR